MPALVDTNVLSDVIRNDADWAPWSLARLEEFGGKDGALRINVVILAELFGGQFTAERLAAATNPGFVTCDNIPLEAAKLAGRAYGEYRRRGGTRRAALADFLIGAHAHVAGMTLITRDASRFRTAFPSLNIVSP